MRGAADLLAGATALTQRPERGGCLGKVLAVVEEHPGLLTREVTALVGEDAGRVSGCLNKLKLEGLLGQDWVRSNLCRWRSLRTKPGAPPSRRASPEVYCGCGMSILLGPAATAEERADPMCISCQESLAQVERLLAIARSCEMCHGTGKGRLAEGPLMAPRKDRCGFCGCTDEAPCLDASGVACCSWAAREDEVCSRCKWGGACPACASDDDSALYLSDARPCSENMRDATSLCEDHRHADPTDTPPDTDPCITVATCP